MSLAAAIDGRSFVTAGNAHGVSGADTVFTYHVTGHRITGTYEGGRIALGQLVGRVTGLDTLDLLSHSLTTDGELLAGWSKGRVIRNADGLLEPSFEWAWLTGDRSGGTSHYVERRSPGAQPARATAKGNDTETGWTG